MSNFSEVSQKIPLKEPDHWISVFEGCTPLVFPQTSEYSTMYHDLARNASFWMFLADVDEDLAETARSQACPCGGRLHRANYPRKPRGGPDDLPAVYRYRFSFCCDRDGCRKRKTPPSVRFLGRKVYFGAVVVLVSALQQGPSPRRVRELSKLFGADRRTIARWRVFWREHFPQTPSQPGCPADRWSGYRWS